MKLSVFADVSLRAILVLAALEPGTTLSSRAIATAVGIPFNHVSKAVSGLARHGLVEVTFGRTGGARLSVAGRTASVGQILRLLDSRDDVADCVGDHATCPLIGECALRHALADAREAFYAALDHLVAASLPTPGQMTPVFATIGLRPHL
ncbi:RrF2 family transcriptional regulator [Mycetocola spongiae]|uniref:RrF2 family transcriptional regulator n=1 Tax=Mycetocola spongiae TaxID=2859226 RepID=UPI001CF33B54|nr:Rrf2 family transcriptional regulator [Mycetocola spongiae]UCR88803.1 Rrf2 family transcriptional regulator [Mycetocola spongiae]